MPEAGKAFDKTLNIVFLSSNAIVTLIHGMCICLKSGMIQFYLSQAQWEQVTDVLWYFIYFF